MSELGGEAIITLELDRDEADLVKAALRLLESTLGREQADELISQTVTPLDPRPRDELGEGPEPRQAARPKTSNKQNDQVRTGQSHRR